ncbi:MAG TPA: hypothetical protein VK986_09700, partial [Tepidisphaeraceae bacterium]|nr:hypothetical protein [Tepidisphaeraceae bacterium]
MTADLRTDWAWADALAAWALRAGWQAAALAGVVAVLLYLAGPRVSPAWRFALWGLVLARLAMPPLVGVPHHWGPAFGAAPAGEQREPSDLSRDGARPTLARENATQGAAPTSAVRPIPGASAVTAPRISEIAPSVIPPTVQSGGSGAGKPSFEPVTNRRTIARALLLTWLAGVLLLLARTALASLRLARAVRRMQPVTDPRLTTALRAASDEMRLRRPTLA